MSLMCKLHLLDSVEFIKVHNIRQEQEDFFKNRRYIVHIEQLADGDYLIGTVISDCVTDLTVAVRSRDGETCEEAFTRLQHEVEAVLLGERGSTR